MIIFRYLGKEVYATLLAIVLILLILFITNQFVHYLNDAAAGKITIRAVMLVMSLQVPILLGYLLPVSLFLGLLLTLGRWYVDHEMAALKACGFSRQRMLGQVLVLAVLVMIVVAWLLLALEPKMQQYRAVIIDDAVASASLDKILPGRFQSFGNSHRVFYAAKVGHKHHQLFNVLFAVEQTTKTKQPRQLQSAPRWDLVTAKSALEKNLPHRGHFLVFNDGYRYIGQPGHYDYQKMKFHQYWLRLTHPTLPPDKRYAAMSSLTLWHHYRTDQHAAAELQWRLSMPISVIILALLALPLGTVKPRQGKFAQLIPAILLYIVYANLMFVCRAWIDSGKISSSLGMWWLHGLFLLIAIILLAMPNIKRRLFMRSRRLSCA